MKKVFALMLPVMISTWVQPVMLTVNSRFASYLYNGSGVSAIEYSTNLYLMIIGVFILSVTNVIFPKLSRLEVADRKEEFTETIRSTMRVSLFFVIPLMAGVMALSYEIINLIYGGGEFDAGDTAITSRALMFTSLGMIGYAVQNIISRAYFAKQDGKTPWSPAQLRSQLTSCSVLYWSTGSASADWQSLRRQPVQSTPGPDDPTEKGEGFLSGKFVFDMIKSPYDLQIMGRAVRFAASSLRGISGRDRRKAHVLTCPSPFSACSSFFLITYLLKLEGIPNDRVDDPEEKGAVRQTGFQKVLQRV